MSTDHPSTREEIEFRHEIGFFETYLDTMAPIVSELLGEWVDDIPVPSENQKLAEREAVRFYHIFWRSFFVSLYSFFESRLIGECRARKSDDILLRFQDIRGQSDIERVKIYFEKVLRIPFPSDRPEWQEIQYYRMLRNCVVHNQGLLDSGMDSGDARRLRDYINRFDLSADEEGNEIILDRYFCEKALKTIANFLHLLLFSTEMPNHD